VTLADRANDVRRKPEQMLGSIEFIPVSSRSISARAAHMQMKLC
jgi:hypothetical protein